MAKKSSNDEIGRMRKLLAEKDYQIEKSSIIIRGLSSDLAKVGKKKHLYEIIGNAFISAVGSLPEIDTPKISKGELKKELDEEAVTILFSDSQIGSLVKSSETGGIGNYNKDVFAKRLERFEQNIVRILKYHPNPMNKLYVDFLGDIIEGSTIFKGQLRQIDLSTVNQVLMAGEKLANTLNFLSRFFEEVAVNAVVGNHGRVGEKDVNSPLDNLDFLVYKFLEERLKNNKRIRFNISPTWWMVVEKMNHRFLLAHGDDFKSWLRIPFYGALRYRQNMTELLKESFNKMVNGKVDFDYLEVGHHHEPAEFSGIIMNGNWVGASEFSGKRLQSGGSPTQMIFGSHPVYGITWIRKIFLEDPRDLPEMKVYK